MANVTQHDRELYLETLGAMSLDELAIEAAGNLESTHSQIVTIEVRRRVANAEIEAAEAQKDATVFLKQTARATVVLAIATFALAVATIILVVITYLDLVLR
jgi:hypothetical protein